MTELQEHLLKLLKEIDALCRTNGIEYYLMSGTAIGAVRHKGFVPWDDDADICMTLENWDKFYSIRNQMRSDRALICMEEDYSARNVINKYVDLTTTRLMTYDIEADIPAGIPVDIFVLDTIPDTREAREAYCTGLLRFVNLFYRSTIHTHRVPYFLDDKSNYAESDDKGLDSVLRERKRAFERYRGMRGGIYALRDPLGFRFFPKESIGCPHYVDFEDTKLPIAADPTVMLTEIYSDDWVNLPRSQDFRPHVAGIIFNLSGNNPLDDFNRTVDQDDLEEVFGSYNREANMVGELNKQQNWERLKLIGSKVRMHYADWDGNGEALLRQLEDEEYDSLDSFFAEYKFFQCHNLVVGDVSFAGQIRRMQPYYIEIGDDFLYVFLRYLMHLETPAAASRVLAARRAWGPSSRKVDELVELVSSVRSSCSLLWGGRYSKALRLLKELRTRYPENLSVSRLYWAARYYCAYEKKLPFGKRRQKRLKCDIENLSDSKISDVSLLLEVRQLIAGLRWEDAYDKMLAAASATRDAFVLEHISTILVENMGMMDKSAELLDEINARLGKCPT